MNKGDQLAEEESRLVLEELASILGSKAFANAPIVRAFLEFVVQETVSGRGDRIKAYVIASEVFGKGAQFDPTNDTIVRTTAARVRKALYAYDIEARHDRHVVITLPKGRYIPTFEVRETPPSAPRRPWPGPALRPFPRRAAAIAAGLVASLALCLLGFSYWSKERARPLGDVAIQVQPVGYGGAAPHALARAVAQTVDIQLAPALSRLGLANIYVQDRPVPETNLKTDADRIAFILKTHLTGPDELRWQLIDAASGQLLWTSRYKLTGTDPVSIDKAVEKVSFQILGEGGAVPLMLERYRGDIFSKSTCLSRAQLLQTVASDKLYPNMRECLERAVVDSPGDPSAWAILSSFYSVRTRYYAKEDPESRAELIERAGRAAEEAEALAPGAYLTKIALMQHALNLRNIEKFDHLQNQLRASYPGDIYLKLRIASRLARLGRGREAMAIYNEAQQDWDFDLKSRAAEIALADFVQGDFEQAWREALRTTSDQRYVLVLKIAILGKLGRAEEAQPFIRRLLDADPNFRDTYYAWLSERSWAHSVAIDMADGLKKANLAVKRDDRAALTWAQP